MLSSGRLCICNCSGSSILENRQLGNVWRSEEGQRSFLVFIANNFSECLVSNNIAPEKSVSPAYKPAIRKTSEMIMNEAETELHMIFLVVQAEALNKDHLCYVW